MSGAVKPLCKCESCGGEFKRADMSKRHDTLCKACGRSKSLSLAGRGNLSASRNPWRSFAKRFAARVEDRWAVTLAERVASELLGDKPDATAAEVALIRNFAIAQTCALLAAGDIGSKGAFDEEGQARNAFRELPRYLAEARQALALLGLQRRAKSTLSLADYLKAKKEEPVIEVKAIEAAK